MPAPGSASDGASFATEALAAVRDAVAVVCEVDPATIERGTSFEDLGADSLARVSIADVLEARLAPGHILAIDDASLGRIASIGELVDLVLAEAQPGAATTR